MNLGWLKRLLNREKITRHPVRCVLYKSVGGVYTADPKIAPEARLIPEISYEEMMEMGSQGAKVVNPRAIEIAMWYGVEILVTDMGNSKGGTLIHNCKTVRG